MNTTQDELDLLLARYSDRRTYEYRLMVEVQNLFSRVYRESDQRIEEVETAHKGEVQALQSKIDRLLENEETHREQVRVAQEQLDEVKRRVSAVQNSRMTGIADTGETEVEFTLPHRGEGPNLAQLEALVMELHMASVGDYDPVRVTESYGETKVKVLTSAPAGLNLVLLPPRETSERRGSRQIRTIAYSAASVFVAAMVVLVYLGVFA